MTTDKEREDFRQCMIMLFGAMTLLGVLALIMLGFALGAYTGIFVRWVFEVAAFIAGWLL